LKKETLNNIQDRGEGDGTGIHTHRWKKVSRNVGKQYQGRKWRMAC